MRSGFLVVDKPAGITSHDVVAAVRAVTGVKKVGHTGTLDPFATGVLALALGNATRVIQYLDESVKVYDATVKLGARTDTGDPTGEVIATAEVPALEAAAVQAVLDGFVGERMQTPPAYSAVKVDGKPLYWYARRGIEVKVEPRPITIRSLQLLELGEDTVRVLLSCGRGTYARVIAEEIGVALGTEGHLVELARRQSGPFHLDDAVTMQELSDLVGPEPGLAWRDVLLGRGPSTERIPWRPRDEVRAALDARLVAPLKALDHLPLLDIDAEATKRVRSGAPPPALPGGVVLGGRFLVAHGDDLVAVGTASSTGPQTERVVPADRTRRA